MSPVGGMSVPWSELTSLLTLSRLSSMLSVRRVAPVSRRGTVTVRAMVRML